MMLLITHLKLLRKVGLPTTFKGVNEEKFWQALFLDKKVRGGKINFVLLKDIGKTFLTPDIPISIIKEVIKGIKE